MIRQNNHRFLIPALACILYFSEGFPFGIATEAVNAYLSFMKVDLTTIGLISSVGLIWSLKFLWAPLIDTAGTYRIWIFGSLIVLSLSIAALGVFAPASPSFWGVLIVLVFASATHDIAVDALAIRITPTDLLGVVNSARVAAYRAAMLAGPAGVGLVAAFWGWRAGFFAAAAIPLIVLAILAFMTPAERGMSSEHQNPLRALFIWIQRPGAWILLAVILLYRMGDNVLVPMIRPYWVERGFSVAEVAAVTHTLGMICTILGAIVGGLFVTRYGIYRGLLVLGIIQMLSNFAYAIVATTNAGSAAMYGAAIIETFCGGLGTAAFLSFLMFICDRDNAATEYAILSAVFAAGRTFAFALSGYLAKDLGFANYYWLTAALALPGLLLLPQIRDRLSASATNGAAAQ